MKIEDNKKVIKETIKLMKKPNKYSLLHLSNIRFAESNLRLLSHNAKLKDKKKKLKKIIKKNNGQSC
jgi:hypothetical protein